MGKTATLTATVSSDVDWEVAEIAWSIDNVEHSCTGLYTTCITDGRQVMFTTAKLTDAGEKKFKLDLKLGSGEMTSCDPAELIIIGSLFYICTLRNIKKY